MARIARSNASKKRSVRQDIIKTLLEARSHYQKLEKLDPLHKPSIRAIAKEFKVPRSTLTRSLDNNWVSIDEFNASKTKIPLAQEEEIVEWCCRVAERNLPMS
ncbi:hypothetical protein FRC18_008248 [Serendipita sp. 400]|nr:hypothetical protein FRC18_008248 [Serendipita sp. 400]